MNTKQIQITFVILLLSLFLVPMIYLERWWGTQIGWSWGFYNIVLPAHGTTNFQWIWEVFLAFPTIDIMYYVAMAATIGVVVDIVLLITSIMAVSRRWFTALTAVLNIAFGVTAIAVTAVHSSYSGNFVFTPLSIVLVVCGGVLIYQITRS